MKVIALLLWSATAYLVLDHTQNNFSLQMPSTNSMLDYLERLLGIFLSF